MAKKKEEPTVITDFYTIGSEIEDACLKLERVKSLLAVTAESVSDSKTEILWLGVDLIDTEIKKLDEITEKIMLIHKKVNEFTLVEVK